jgi:uncharacterized repeat protein (TIGR01451 family)
VDTSPATWRWLGGLAPSGAGAPDRADFGISACLGPTRFAGARPLGCTDAPPTTTNIEARKTGPTQVDGGAMVTYTLTLANTSTVDAQNVVLIDELPSTLTAVTTAPPATTLTATQATWTVGTLPAGQALTFTITATGTLLDVVSATTTTYERPSDNDGSLANAQVTTQVVPVVPPNNPPVVSDLTITMAVNTSFSGFLPMTDPDPGQEVAASLTMPPAHGTMTGDTTGAGTYTPDTDFTGRDQSPSPSATTVRRSCATPAPSSSPSSRPRCPTSGSPPPACPSTSTWGSTTPAPRSRPRCWRSPPTAPPPSARTVS